MLSAQLKATLWALNYVSTIKLSAQACSHLQRIADVLNCPLALPDFRIHAVALRHANKQRSDAKTEMPWHRGWRIKKKTNKDQQKTKSEDQEKKQIRIKKNKIVDFIVKLVERRQVRGSKKNKM